MEGDRLEGEGDRFKGEGSRFKGELKEIFFFI